MAGFSLVLGLLRKSLRGSRIAVLLIACPLCFAGTNETLRPFTVKDSIEISHIIDATEHCTIDMRGANPPGEPLISPDKKHYLLITQRGVLSANKLEATLWVFDQEEIAKYVSKLSPNKPHPRPIVTFSAGGHLQVMSDARWIDSNRIAFLGKNAAPYQQLFIAELNSGAVTAVTKKGQFVSAYDINSDTIAFTTLRLEEQSPDDPNEVLEAVKGKYIYSLLYPKSIDMEELTEYLLWTTPSVLHVQRNGLDREIPLRLFFPSLALSPNGKFVITVAPIHELPSSWNQYQPVEKMKDLQLSTTNSRVLSDDNPWRASQYVLVNLETGGVVPIIDAPAGRSLGYGAPTKAFWLADSRRAILTNTFLPLSGSADSHVGRTEAPVLAMVDVLTKEIGLITYIESSPWAEAKRYRLDSVVWNQARKLLELSYVGSGEAGGEVHREAYELTSLRWVKASADHPVDGADNGLSLSVSQDLNHPPALLARAGRREPASIVWDPNTQLEYVALGNVSIYHWRGKDGFAWSGLLALPPNRQPGRRLPLVIQTHGFESDQFYADGTFTTGSGGRALLGKNIIVLQMDMPLMNYETPKDGPFEVAGFEGAIEQLAKDDLVDPHRVGVIGFSYTCFHVLYTLTHRPDLFAVASITDGVNMGYVQWVMSVNAGDGQEFMEKTNGAGAPFGKELSTWAETAPGFNLDKVQTPLLISALGHGELIAQWETYSGLRRLGRPVDMLWLRTSNAAHILVEPRVRFASQQSAIDWFDFWLNGSEDHDPRKSDQYMRWRELREHATERNLESGRSPMR